MWQKIGEFLRPREITVVILLILLAIAPVFYVYSEPERTNYSPGEDQNRIIKSKIHPSIINEYFFHTNGNIDVLLGLVERNYFTNMIGIPLLILYYLFASSVSRLVEGNKGKVQKTCLSD